MVAEARRDPAWEVLGSVPFFGPVRVALLLATMKTPWRFRTKRNLWAYAGLAVVTESSADHEFRCRASGTPPAQASDARAEHESQPRPQGRLQEHGNLSDRSGR
jgi:hypothetical protein